MPAVWQVPKELLNDELGTFILICRWASKGQERLKVFLWATLPFYAKESTKFNTVSVHFPLNFYLDFAPHFDYCSVVFENLVYLARFRYHSYSSSVWDWGSPMFATSRGRNGSPLDLWSQPGAMHQSWEPWSRVSFLPCNDCVFTIYLNKFLYL